MKREIELTVKLKEKISYAILKLELRGFIKNKTLFVNDVYMIKEDIDINTTRLAEILKNLIIIRKVFNKEKEEHEIIYKVKEYSDKCELTKKEKYIVRIEDVEEAKSFFEKIGYRKLLEVSDDYEEMKKDNVIVGIQNVYGLGTFVEIEETENEKNEQDVEKIKEKLIDYLKTTELDYDDSNYYINKIELLVERLKNSI